MTDCARGCSILGQHNPTCGCTNECPEHKPHCKGCLPKPAEVAAYCQRCAYRFREALEEIPELVYRVADEGLTKGERQDRKATTTSVPTPSPHWDTADEVILWAAGWAYALSRETGDPDPIPCNISGIPTAVVHDSIRYMADRVTQALSAGFADDLFSEAVQHRGKLVQMLGGKPPADTPTDHLITIEDASRVTGKGVSTLRRWIANGKFTKRATVKDAHLYSEVEVRTVAGEQRCAMSDLFHRDCAHCRRVA